MDQRGFPTIGIPVATTEGAATSLAAASTTASVSQANAVGWSVTRRRLD